MLILRAGGLGPSLRPGPANSIGSSVDASPPASLAPAAATGTPGGDGGPLVPCVVARSVALNDTCRRIARDYGITRTQLLRLNPRLNCSRLVVGQRLCVQAAEGGE